jgi:hypothetical protein
MTKAILGCNHYDCFWVSLVYFLCIVSQHAINKQNIRVIFGTLKMDNGIISARNVLYIFEINQVHLVWLRSLLSQPLQKSHSSDPNGTSVLLLPLNTILCKFPQKTTLCNPNVSASFFSLTVVVRFFQTK